ncbi:MAG: hypothetical protein MUC78_09905 [Bacteroidales bacterium]|nr:hypothetical protein [Bacteroidales bacterium]
MIPQTAPAGAESSAGASSRSDERCITPGVSRGWSQRYNQSPERVTDNSQFPSAGAS